MTKTPFKFSDEIMSSCTDTDDFPLRENLDKVWRKDITRKNKREIVTALKTYAKDYVFKCRHTSNLGLVCESYYRLKSLSWSKNYPDQLWAEFYIMNLHKDNDGFFTLSVESDHDPIYPNPCLGEPIPLPKFKKTLFNLLNRISLNAIGEYACF